MMTRKFISIILTVAIALTMPIMTANAAEEVEFISAWGYSIEETPKVPTDDEGIEIHFERAVDENTLDAYSCKLENIKDDGVYRMLTGVKNAAAPVRGFKFMDGTEAADIADRTVFIEFRILMKSFFDGASFSMFIHSGETFDSLNSADSARIDISAKVSDTHDRVGMFENGNYGNRTYTNYMHGEWIDVKWKINNENLTQNIWVNGIKMASEDKALLNNSEPINDATVLCINPHVPDVDVSISYIKAYTEDAPENLLIDQSFDNISDENELQDYIIMDNVGSVNFETLPNEIIGYNGVLSEDKRVYSIKPVSPFEEGIAYKLSLSGIRSEDETSIAEGASIEFVAEEGMVIPGVTRIADFTDLAGNSLVQKGYSNLDNDGFKVIFDNDVNELTLNEDTVKFTRYTTDKVFRLATPSAVHGGGRFYLKDNGENISLSSGTLVMETSFHLNNSDDVAGGVYLSICSKNEGIEEENARVCLETLGTDLPEMNRVGMVEGIGGTTNWGNKRYKNYPKDDQVTLKWEIDVANLTQNLYIDGNIISGTENAPLFGDKRPFGDDVCVMVSSFGKIDGSYDMSYIKLYMNDEPTKILLDERFEDVGSISEIESYEGSSAMNDYISVAEVLKNPSPVEYTGEYENKEYIITPAGLLDYNCIYNIQVTSGVESLSGKPLFNPSDVNVRSLWYGQMYISSVEVDKNNGLNATVRVTNVSSGKHSAVAVIVVTRDGLQRGMTKQSIVLDGAKTKNITITYTDDAPYDSSLDDVSVYVWDSLETMNPIFVGYSNY